MAKQAKLVRQDADGIWLALPLAAKKAGLTKPELMRRAVAGNVRFTPDDDGKPAWFFEPEIAAMARGRREAELAKPARQPRKPSAKALEKWYAKQAEDLRNSARHGHLGPGWHGDKVMIAEIFASEAKRKKGPEGQ